MKLPLLFFFGIFWLSAVLGSWKYELSASDVLVPALSYHNIEAKIGQNPAYYCTPAVFEEQIAFLKGAGYESVLPADIQAYHIQKIALPAKPILISFDDTRKSHILLAAPILEKHGFRGTFFIMTVSIGKKNYLTQADIKELSDRGHEIGIHTWDHQNLSKLPADQWAVQVDQPKRNLEEITGKKVDSFAYPYGIWNKESITKLKTSGVTTAFQLTGKPDEEDPMLTLQRIMVSGNWSGQQLVRRLEDFFGLKAPL